MRAVCLAIAVTISAVGSAPAQQFMAPRVTTAPTIDGVPDDPAWVDALAVPLTRQSGTPETDAATQACACFTDEAIYLLFVCHEPRMDRLVNNERRHDGAVWMDDCVEVFLAPDARWRAGYYHIVVNAGGVVRDEFWVNRREDLSWSSAARVATKRLSDRWIVEMALPIEALDRVPIVSDHWAGNLARERYAEPELISAAPGTDFHNAATFGEFVLPGIHETPNARRLSAGAAGRQAQSLLDQLRLMRGELVAEPVTSRGRALASSLEQWISRIRNRQGWRGQARVARDAQIAMPSLQQEAVVVRALEHREALAARLRAAGPYAVFPIPAMTKLRPEELPESGPGNAIRLNAARGEGESAQLLVSSLGEPLRNVRVTARLRGPAGQQLTPEISLVGYVPVTRPTAGGFQTAGRYPDPLLPNAPFQVPADESRAVWLTVWVPRDAAPGDYTGVVTVAPEGLPATEQPLRLRVHDVTLPEVSRLQTAVLIWSGPAALHYRQAWGDDLYRRFIEQGLKYRFTAPPPLPWETVFSKGDDGRWTATWDQLDRAVEEWTAKGATAFSCPIIPGGTTPPTGDIAEDVAAKLRLFDAHLVEKGWSDRFYSYTFDEPPASEVENLKQLCAFVREHAPHLRILLTAQHKDLAGYINLWVPHSTTFDPVFTRQRQTAGDTVWMYVCIGTAGTSFADNWRIDWVGTSHRAVGWWCWRYDCTGFLYWCVNYWQYLDGTPCNVFEDPMAFPNGNGDGFLFYPNLPDGLPHPSVRVELQRDGFEDYDLLCMLRDAVKAAGPSADRVVLRRAGQILSGEQIIPKAEGFEKDEAVYDRLHAEMLDLLERLQRP